MEIVVIFAAEVEEPFFNVVCMLCSKCMMTYIWLQKYCSACFRQMELPGPAEKQYIACHCSVIYLRKMSVL